MHIYFWFWPQVLALVFIRKLLDLFFTKRELSWLDDLMPESKKKTEDDKKLEAQNLVNSMLNHLDRFQKGMGVTC